MILFYWFTILIYFCFIQGLDRFHCNRFIELFIVIIIWANNMVILELEAKKRLPKNQMIKDHVISAPLLH